MSPIAANKDRVQVENDSEISALGSRNLDLTAFQDHPSSLPFKKIIVNIIHRNKLSNPDGWLYEQV
jgi:hypothetical protein